jgi:MFS family permease
MFLAPFSELNGRRPVFLATGLLFVICQLGCALTDSYGGMLAARLFAGIGGSTFSTMVGGILADIWTPAERNTPMVIFTGATLFGTGLGPLVSGFIAQRLLWMWVFYVQLIVSGLIVSLVAITFRETRQPIILAQKAKILNKWYEKLESAGAIGVEMPNKAPSNSSNEKLQRVSAQRIRYKVLAEETRPSLNQMLKISLTRPTILLVTEPILICFSAWISFDWAVLYLEFGALPLVFQTNYGFNLEQSFAVFAAVSIGGIVATIISIYQDKWAVKKFGKRFTGRPEGRLWFTCAWGLMLPIGLFWFGFTCYPSVHWIVPCIALVFITIGIFSIFLATFNYIADCYQTYASSALAAAGVCRNFLAGGITLVVVQMFQAMGYQAASSTLGGIGLILALGPILLIWFGARVRLQSRVARQFVKDDEI